MCHPTDRSHIVTHKQCTQPCRKIPLKCPHNHPCKRRCNEECGPCLHVLDEEVILPCGHTVPSPTCDSVCDATSRKKLAKKCREEVTFTFLPCNHRCTTTCANVNSEHPACPSICGETLGCGHNCQLRLVCSFRTILHTVFQSPHRLIHAIAHFTDVRHAKLWGILASKNVKGRYFAVMSAEGLVMVMTSAPHATINAKLHVSIRNVLGSVATW